MGSAVPASAPDTPTMSLFKALLLSALAVTAKAAPTEVVAGRVVTHAVPSLHTFHSNPPLHAVRGVAAVHTPPAVHVVRGVPAVHLVHHAVPQAPAVTEVRLVEPEDAEPAAQYSFGYSITDSVTGDSKSRQGSGDGDVVSGSYSVADPDGRIRTVTYTADDVHGFQATVTYDGQPGPVAIPFNEPSTDTAPVDASNFQSTDSAVTAVRTSPIIPAFNDAESLRTVDNLGNTVSAVRTIPTFQNVNNAAGVDAVQHFGNAVTAVQTVPGFHTFASTRNNIGAGFRTFPTFTATPNTALRAFPTFHATPALHQVHGLDQGAVAVRTLPAVTAFRHNPAVHHVHSAAPSFIRTGDGLSRLHFVQ